MNTDSLIKDFAFDIELATKEIVQKVEQDNGITLSDKIVQEIHSHMRSTLMVGFNGAKALLENNTRAINNALIHKQFKEY